MADEIVGSAYVRIKALTKGLAKDIEKGVKKGIKDAKLEKAGKDGGERLGTSLGDSTVDSASDRIKKRSGDIISDDVFDNVRKQFKGRGLLDGVDIFPEGAFDRQSEIVRSGMARINDNIDKAWPKDRDLLPGLGRSRDNIERDSRGITTALDSISNSIKRMSGGPGGLKVPGGFLGGSVAAIGAAVVAVLPYIQDVGSAVLAYATGLVAQVGFLVTALSGLGVAAGAAIGGAMAPILPIMLAFKAETEELIAFKDSMKAAGEEFQRIGVATQATLLPALDDAVFQLGELVPMLSEYGLFVGQSVGNFAKFAAAVLTSEKAQDRLGVILGSSLRILDMLLPTLLHVGDILSGIWLAATPIAERFVGTLSDMVLRWKEIIDFGLYTGTLTDTLNTWYDRAELLGSALGNLSGALFDILSVGADSADSVFIRFDEWAERFRSWTESEVGQNKLALIFDNALAVMREVNAVATGLFDGIFGRLDDVGGVDSMVGALQRFQEILPDIKEDIQGFIDTIDGINNVIGPALKAKFIQTFEELREPIGRLVFAILDVMNAMEESGAFEVFLDLMTILADVLTTVLSIPGFGTFIGYMLAFGAAAKVASFAVGPLLAVLGPFVGVIQGLAAAAAGKTLVSTADGLVRMSKAATAAQGLTGTSIALNNVATATKGTAAGGLAGSLARIGPLVGALGPWGIAAGVGIGAAAYAFYRINQNAQAFKQEVRQVKDALGELNGGLNITKEGLAKYIEESSRFESRNQIDDLEKMGLSVDELATKVANGSINYRNFADDAVKSGQIYIGATAEIGKKTDLSNVSQSLEGLREQYDLTDKQMEKLTSGEKIRADGVTLQLAGNDDLIESFKEMNEAIGQAAKDSMAEFVTNTQNVRLLGVDAVNAISAEIFAADKGQAGQIMADALDQLGTAARNDTLKVKGLTDAMWDQIDAQVAHLRGNERLIEKNRLARAEEKKLFDEIRSNLKIVADMRISADVVDEAAFQSLDRFSNLTANMDFSKFQEFANGDDVDKLMSKFPGLAHVTGEMFDNLANLPADKFKASAEAIGFDADSLKAAMDGAAGAIKALGDQAVSTLPTIGSLLDEATSTNDEGEPLFNEKKFRDSIENRLQETSGFADNIAKIKRDSGEETARLAAQEGPKAAKNIAEMVTGGDKGLEDSLTKLRESEAALRTQIDTVLGPGIKLEYLAQAQPIAEGWGIGLANGINSPTTAAALRDSSMSTLNYLARGFRGQFVISDNKLEFRPSGDFRLSQTQFRRTASSGGGGLTLSKGGFVGMDAFGGGPSGTDTVPAWLTPGEFVLRRAVAQAIPAGVLKSLNTGDPRIMSVLKSMNNTRFSNPDFVLSPSVPVTPALSGSRGSTFGPNSVVIYAQGTSAAEVFNEFDHRVNWKLTSRGDQ